MKEAAATNGPEGTVSKKTQVLLELVEQGMARLQNNLKSINQDYLGDVDLRTLLTTIVENLHAVSPLQKRDFHSFTVCSRFPISDFRFLISDFWFLISDFWFRISGFGFQTDFGF